MLVCLCALPSLHGSDVCKRCGRYLAEHGPDFYVQNFPFTLQQSQYQPINKQDEILKRLDEIEKKLSKDKT